MLTRQETGSSSLGARQGLTADVGAQPGSQVREVVIRLGGDSGDGIQLIGDRLSAASAVAGNDLATLPDFPAEIRAPAGTPHGVSAFQIRIADHEVTTPGDAPDVLLAMNPAALHSELGRLLPGGMVILNSDAFTDKNLTKAGYNADPRTNGDLDNYSVVELPMTDLTKRACEPFGIKPRDAERSKNFFALGVLSWMYHRDVELVRTWIDSKFAKREQVRQANRAALDAGYALGETSELVGPWREIRPNAHPEGTYRVVNGNTALAWGLIAAGIKARLPVFLGSYPITPASSILHELAKHPQLGVRTFQAEDEIAAVSSAIGAAFGGNLAVTTTSGPGLSLKAEALGLAVSVEVPLIVVDVQRGGPSTGLPTKTEAADLLQAMFGRHGECPLPILATSHPGDCFEVAVEAARIAIDYRTPVIILTDGYVANAVEPWKLPDLDAIAEIHPNFATEPNHEVDGSPRFWPFLRDDETLARPWALPGTPGLEHRVGGIEKADGSGDISYDPENHSKMVHLRQAKVDGIAAALPPVTVDGPEDADVTLLTWGSTWGATVQAVADARVAGRSVAHVHLRHLNPFPPNLGEVLKGAKRVLVPELNLGQLTMLVRAKYLVDATAITKVAGQPFTSAEILAQIMDGTNPGSES